MTDDEEIAWQANTGEQTTFLQSGDKEVLYGGRAGCGKSDALLIAAIRHYENRFHRAIIFKETFPELRDMMDRAHEIYPLFGGRYIAGKRRWRFPSGATMEFGYIRKRDDIKKYKRQWNFIGIDDLTHWKPDSEDRDKSPINYAYSILIGSRLRATKESGLPTEIRCTTNPDQIGRVWVKRRFKIPDDGSASEVFDKNTKSWRIFIPAKRLAPQLAGTDYELALEGLHEAQKRMLKDGRWDVVEGAMFSEFDYDLHTCDRFRLNKSAEFWRGADDGFNAKAAVLWFAKQDGRIYIVNELYKSGMVSEVMAEKVLHGDSQIPLQENGETVENELELEGTIDSSAFDNNDSDSDSEDKSRGGKMNKAGCNWTAASKPSGSRVRGWALIHDLLQRKLADGKPALMIFRNCVETIRCLPAMPISLLKPEDVDTDCEDHIGDALRYGLQHKKISISMKRLHGL